MCMFCRLFNRAKPASRLPQHVTQPVEDILTNLVRARVHADECARIYDNDPAFDKEYTRDWRLRRDIVTRAEKAIQQVLDGRL